MQATAESICGRRSCARILIRAEIHQQSDELIAAEAGKRVAVPNAAGQTVRDFDEELIADVVASLSLTLLNVRSCCESSTRRPQAPRGLSLHPVGGGVCPCTTSTGHFACSEAAALTAPRSSPANPP